MKNKDKIKASKLLKNFELGKNELTLLNGGTSPCQYTTSYYLEGNAACSVSCPDAHIDYMP